MTELTRDKLNQLRRMAGVPQDFAPVPNPQPIVEDVIPGMSQVLRGGKHKFYLVTNATPNSELGDIISEVDIRALATIAVGSNENEDAFRGWELFPHEQQKAALDLARTRLAQVVREVIGDGAYSRNAHNTPHPRDDELNFSTSDENDEEGNMGEIDMERENKYKGAFAMNDGEGGYEDPRDDYADEMGANDYGDEGEGDMSDDVMALSDLATDDEMSMEPETNICPDCEGGEHPPVDGSECERCDGTGEVLDGEAYGDEMAMGDEYSGMTEGKKAKKDYDGDGKVESPEAEFKGSRKKAIKKAKEEQEETTGKDYDGDGKVESSEKEHKGVVNKAIKKSKVKEAHYHTNDNYPLTHVDKGQPHSVDAQYDTVYDKPEENEEDYKPANDTTPIKVPAKITTALGQAIREVKAEAEKATPRDTARASYYEDTAEAFQIVHDFLKEKTVEGLKQAQYYSQKMMNVQRALLPDVVWKFLVDGGSARSLKSYVNDVKEPVTGKPFDTVDVDVLNKNTHTQ